jgi:hypothetical protein
MWRKPTLIAVETAFEQSAAESIHVPKPIRGSFKEECPLTGVLAHMFHNSSFSVM